MDALAPRSCLLYPMSMDGFILVDKPIGWTSHDIVAKVRSLLKKQGVVKPKVGHAGTLDPLATGLLIVLVGGYTKRAQEFSKLDKTYEVEMKLGETSVTGDAEGEKTQVSSKKPTEKEVDKTLNSFVGEIMQTPHKYSAMKVGGKRAYKLARAGKVVKIEPRKVQIYSIDNVKYEYPIVKFTVKVSSGTYIRSLVEDIGKKLATGAYMTSLRRTTIGKFSIQDSASVNGPETLANIEQISSLA